MEGHFEVDSHAKLIHAGVTKPANLHDALCLSDLLYSQEIQVSGDSAYQGQSEVMHTCGPKARDLTSHRHRRLQKNGSRLFATYPLANLYLVRGRLLLQARA